MATGLTTLGVSDEVINADQGRAKVGIIGTYNLYAYDKERQAAAEAWERKWHVIVTGADSNVLPMTRRHKKGLGNAIPYLPFCDYCFGTANPCLLDSCKKIQAQDQKRMG